MICALQTSPCVSISGERDDSPEPVGTTIDPAEMMTLWTLEKMIDAYNIPVTNTKQMDVNGLDQSAEAREKKHEAYMALFDSGMSIQDRAVIVN